MATISVITPSIRPKYLEQTRQSLINQTYKDFEWLVDINWTGTHDLNRAFNRLIKRSSGDIIVILQDAITIPEDALEKVAKFYENNIEMVTMPVGKIKNENDSVKWDWRKMRIGEEISWQDWEIDFGACLKSDLYEIGGFDEELDQFWSCDNVNTAYRAFLIGKKFKVLDIPVIAIDHDAIEPHPFRKNYKPSFNNERMKQFEIGKKINYLA